MFNESVLEVSSFIGIWELDLTFDLFMRDEKLFEVLLKIEYSVVFWGPEGYWVIDVSV